MVAFLTKKNCPSRLDNKFQLNLCFFAFFAKTNLIFHLFFPVLTQYTTWHPLQPWYSLCQPYYWKETESPTGSTHMILYFHHYSSFSAQACWHFVSISPSFMSYTQRLPSPSMSRATSKWVHFQGFDCKNATINFSMWQSCSSLGILIWSMSW